MADLAEQLAVAGAAGTAYASVTPETVRVESEGGRVHARLTAPVVRDGPDGALGAAGVRGLGVLLAQLVGDPAAGGPAPPRPGQVAESLWVVIRSATAAAAVDRPAAAVMAQQLRDAARDLLLDLSPAAAAAPSPVAPPRYLPDQPFAGEPDAAGRPAGRRRRTILIAATTAIAVVLAGGGVLLPVAGVRLPSIGAAFGAGAPRAAASVSPSAAPPATPSPSPTASKAACCAITSYRVPGGSSQPDVRGTLIWYERSVGVSGSIRSKAPSCAAVAYVGLAGGNQVAHYQSPAKCGTVAVSTTLGATAATGDITEVDVALTAGGKAVGQVRCLRQTHACTEA